MRFDNSTIFQLDLLIGNNRYDCALSSHVKEQVLELGLIVFLMTEDTKVQGSWKSRIYKIVL